MDSNRETKILYEDKDIRITEKQIVIKWYFFPIAKSKKIPLSKIQKVQRRGLGFAKYRLWGMDVSAWGYWLPGDAQRMSREQFIGLHTGSSVKPSFTTQNINQVYHLLCRLTDKQKKQKAQMVNNDEKEQQQLQNLKKQ